MLRVMTLVAPLAAVASPPPAVHATAVGACTDTTVTVTVTGAGLPDTIHASHGVLDSSEPCRGAARERRASRAWLADAHRLSGRRPRPLRTR